MRASSAVFAIFSLALCARPLCSQDAAALYRQGVDQQRAGDLLAAAKSYAQVLALDPTNIAARSNRGAALSGMGRYDDAIGEYQIALKGAPAQAVPFLRRNLALAFYKSGRLSEASPLLLDLHTSLPGDRNLTLLAADCLLQLGEPAQALTLLEPLSSDAASDKALAYVLGTAYLKAGKSAEAQRILDPILKDDSSAEGRYALAMAMFTSGDYPSALRAFEKAIALNPDLPHIQSYYGQSLVFTGDPDAALAAFHKQLDEDPNDYDANFQAGMILSRRKANKEAEELLRRAMLLRPKSLAAKFGVAQSVLAQGRPKEAQPLLEAVLKESPTYGAAHAKLAEVYIKSGKPKEAAAEAALAAKYTPKAQASGLAAGKRAPRMALAGPEGGRKVEITSPEPGKPTVLAFGSYSCPNFRKAAPVLNRLSESMAKEVAFLQVYIREAHSTDQWQSTVNERDHVEMAPATSATQKGEYAMMCQRSLHLKFSAVVDSLDDAAEKAYDAWPSRVYVISREGTILYSSALIEEEFDGAALEAAIKSAAKTISTRPKPR